MNYHIDLQLASKSAGIPEKSLFVRWATSALQHIKDKAEVSICIVDEEESQTLNRQYRNKDKPTNVLSFSADIPDFVDSQLMGDLVICAPVVFEEASEQKKRADAHWAHMVIHGILHLSGYDHIEESDAEQMESLEIQILDDLGFPSPYAEQ